MRGILVGDFVGAAVVGDWVGLLVVGALVVGDLVGLWLVGAMVVGDLVGLWDVGAPVVGDCVGVPVVGEKVGAKVPCTHIPRSGFCRATWIGVGTVECQRLRRVCEEGWIKVSGCRGPAGCCKRARCCISVQVGTPPTRRTCGSTHLRASAAGGNVSCVCVCVCVCMLRACMFV